MNNDSVTLFPFHPLVSPISSLSSSTAQQRSCLIRSLRVQIRLESALIGESAERQTTVNWEIQSTLSRGHVGGSIPRGYCPMHSFSPQSPPPPFNRTTRKNIETQKILMILITTINRNSSHVVISSSWKERDQIWFSLSSIISTAHWEQPRGSFQLITSDITDHWGQACLSLSPFPLISYRPFLGHDNCLRFQNLLIKHPIGRREYEHET